MNDLELSDILNALNELPDNWLEQIQSMCEYIICERIDQANMEEEA